MRKKVMAITLLAAAAVLGLTLVAAVPQRAVSSRAYVGHENDLDIGNFIRAYPKAAGTRLDDCQTCHRGGTKGADTEREYSPCGYCHLLQYPNPRYQSGVPKDYESTLNAFGLAYENAGRTVEALAAIATLDSDGDGFTNGAEIAALRYPGDAASRPGQPQAPFAALSWDDVHRLPAVKQFMLMNATKEPTDDYVTYTGVKVVDLLAAAGVDLKGTEGITVFAPDGYSIDYSIDDVARPFPQGFFYAAPAAIKDKDKAFVKYPERIPPGVADGHELPAAPWLLLAFEREGKPLDPSLYEKGTGRLAGEGPYRLVKPQRDLMGDPSKPGRPDRSSKAKAYGDGWDFNPRIDHNAGACVRGACVIRVNPVPKGFEEYDWKNGWPLVAERRIVIYGRGVR
ncbi:MAG: GEGP motif-containing diheme protein [Candidatus Aminicenantales bacterium]